MEVSQGSVTPAAAGDVGDPEKCVLGKCKSCVTIKLLHRRQTGEGVSHTGGREAAAAAASDQADEPSSLQLGRASPKCPLYDFKF